MDQRSIMSLALVALFGCGGPPAMAENDGGLDLVDAAAPADAATSIDTGADAGVPAAPGLAIYPVRPIAIVDTTNGGPCGTYEPLDSASNTRIDVSLGACEGLALPEGAGAIAATLTVIPHDPAATVQVRAGAPEHLALQPMTRAGPSDPGTTGILAPLGAGGTLRIEILGGGTADVVLELTAVLAPSGPGAHGVVILDAPLRIYTERWDESGVWHGPTTAGVDRRLPLNEIEEEPLGALPADVAGVIGVAHVGPDGLCEPGATVSLGPGRPESDTTGLARISTCAPDTHAPSRSSTGFVIGASATQQLTLRADGANAVVYLDVVGYLVPYREGAALYHPIAPLGLAVDLAGVPRRVLGGIEGALALSGRIAGDSDSWGSAVVGHESSITGPVVLFSTLEVGIGSAPSAFTTRVDAEGAFVVDATVDSRLELLVDAYWAD